MKSILVTGVQAWKILTACYVDKSATLKDIEERHELLLDTGAKLSCRGSVYVLKGYAADGFDVDLAMAMANLTPDMNLNPPGHTLL